MREQIVPGRFFLPRKTWPGNEASIPLAMERVVRGHHVFRATWTPWTGQMLQVHAEAQDRYAVAILIDDAIIGHVPCEFTRITWH